MHGDPPGSSATCLCQIGANCDDFDVYVGDADNLPMGNLGEWVWGLLYFWILEQVELITGEKSEPGQRVIRIKWHRWVPDSFVEIVFYDPEHPWKFRIVQKQ